MVGELTGLSDIADSVGFVEIICKQSMSNAVRAAIATDQIKDSFGIDGI
jgi:hypothetical protein